MIRFAENLNKMITAGLGGALEAPSTEVAVGHRLSYLESSGAVASFETNIVAPIRSLRVDMQPVQAGSGDPSPENIRPIAGRDTVRIWQAAAYDPSADPALTIPLGQTVYGGTLDVTTGTMTVYRAIVDMGTLTGWVKSTLTKGSIFRIVLSGKKTGLSPLLCSQYAYQANGGFGGADMTVTDSASASYSQTIFITDTRYNDYTTLQFAAAMSGVMLCYRLAEPFTIQLDPSTLSTLKGQNNVWSDAGDVTLEYPYYEETEGY